MCLVVAGARLGGAPQDTPAISAGGAGSDTMGEAQGVASGEGHYALGVEA